MIPITDQAAWQKVAALPAALVLKHGAHCPISAHARDELTSFESTHREPPVYSLEVTAHGDLSRSIAQEIGVEHQSPQLLHLSNGRPKWHADHYDITADDVAARVGR
ncbi:MAG: hypothetical protein JWL60_434 [Gemmatimonadetes bacterium]|jgi:bacillithiol system protein YtxJ|nr:hypothetical protein [Gemmatimonadota bacterium]